MSYSQFKRFQLEQEKKQREQEQDQTTINTTANGINFGGDDDQPELIDP
jgi:hypothetical protein